MPSDIDDILDEPLITPDTGTQKIPLTRSDYRPPIQGKITPIQDYILVENLEEGEKKTKYGILVPDDNMKDRGIRARWGKIYKVGDKQKDVKPGQWILVSHGRWTRYINFEDETGYEFKLYKIDPKNNYECVLLVSDDEPEEYSAFVY